MNALDAPAQFHDVGTARMAYRKVGDGPPMLLAKAKLLPHEEQPALVAAAVVPFFTAGTDARASV
jgi:hypothetical protein